MRLIYLAAILAAASSAPAFGQPFKGFSVAAVGGYDYVSAGGLNASGAAYGLGAGYDFRTGNAALGVQLEAADATTSLCSGGFCIDAGRDLYAGVRGGGVVGGNTLIYGLVGYSNARAKFTGGGHVDLDGVRGGLGVEHQPGSAPSWFVRFEARYTNYELGFERWQGIGGVGFRF